MATSLTPPPNSKVTAHIYQNYGDALCPPQHDKDPICQSPKPGVSCPSCCCTCNCSKGSCKSDEWIVCSSRCQSCNPGARFTAALHFNCSGLTKLGGKIGGGLRNFGHGVAHTTTSVAHHIASGTTSAWHHVTHIHWQDQIHEHEIRFDDPMDFWVDAMERSGRVSAEELEAIKQFWSTHYHNHVLVGELTRLQEEGKLDLRWLSDSWQDGTLHETSWTAEERKAYNDDLDKTMIAILDKVFEHIKGHMDAYQVGVDQLKRERKILDENRGMVEAVKTKQAIPTAMRSFKGLGPGRNNRPELFFQGTDGPSMSSSGRIQPSKKPGTEFQRAQHVAKTAKSTQSFEPSTFEQYNANSRHQPVCQAIVSQCASLNGLGAESNAWTELSKCQNGSDGTTSKCSQNCTYDVAAVLQKGNKGINEYLKAYGASDSAKLDAATIKHNNKVLDEQVLKYYCVQQVTTCPEDSAGTNEKMPKCTRMVSTAAADKTGDKTDHDICMGWWNRQENGAADTQLLSYCRQTPTADCGCLNYTKSESYKLARSLKFVSQNAPAMCWAVPCAGALSSPNDTYLVTLASTKSVQRCPSLCQQVVNQENQGGGDGDRSNQIKNLSLSMKCDGKSSKTVNGKTTPGVGSSGESGGGGTPTQNEVNQAEGVRKIELEAARALGVSTTIFFVIVAAVVLAITAFFVVRHSHKKQQQQQQQQMMMMMTARGSGGMGDIPVI